MATRRLRFLAPVLLAALVAAISLTAAAHAQNAPVDTAYFDRHIQFQNDPRVPCKNDAITVTVVNDCTPCMFLQSFTSTNPYVVNVIMNWRGPEACRAESCHAEARSLRVGPHPASPSSIIIAYITVNVPPDSLHPSGSQVRFMRSWRFPVRDTCAIRVPPNDSLQFVRQVRLGPNPMPCDTCPAPVCAGQPFPVTVVGVLPSSCHVFDGLSLDSADVTNTLRAPVINVNVHVTGGMCVDEIRPFNGGIMLPAVRPGRHPFYVREVVNDRAQGRVSVSRPIPYSVIARDSCPPPPPIDHCVWPFLEPAPSIRSNVSLCDLEVFPGGVGTQHFSVRSDSLPLAGIQGVVSAGAGLHILGLMPIGPAAGMHLVTRPTDFGGVSFVMYADHGAPIPPRSMDPVLAVTVKADSLARPGDRIWLAGGLMAASDSMGRTLPICPVMTLVVVAAQVCIASPTTCDANADGMTNVADLVRMARCWFRPATCPDSLRARPDCTHDGAFHVDDILCCARAILGGPREGSPRDATQLRFSFGEPRIENGRVRVPLVIRGATEMNGALLHVSYPSDRYTPVQPADAAADAAWMPLTEFGADDIVLGVLRLDDAAGGEVTVPLEFTLKDGKLPGGTLSVDQGSAVAPDGSTLVIDLSQARASLPAIDPAATFSRVELLAGPNPSPGLTRFTVQLPAAGLVELSIYDIAGRRIATPWHGAMAAGQREVTWDGTGLRRGFYFARLSVNGAIRTRRVLLQPER